MKITLTIIVLVLAVLITNCDGWWNGKLRGYKCNEPSGGEPYYFGTTDLSCMGKRKAPSRSTRSHKHRWILYKGYYFERLNKSDVYNRGFSTNSDKCSTRRESRPAGYSSLSVDCIMKCTNSYERKYGSYRRRVNDGRHFANRLSDILCTRKTCPSWC
ncbi:unnamed protein product [Mytilus edulis]|uniref:Uncharacterized protein n=1 Tax=Mytilus edulis TaxID=6550 RepID=A0A8S3RR75_MYTED|nr:unnamed protein product [Mytilus edulis]